MSAGIVLDHVGIAVRDLAVAKADYERLGFASTPLSLHAAPTAPGAPSELTGSGNHCLVLRDGYLELIGVVDPSKASTARTYLERHEGAHILGLGARNATQARRLIARRGISLTEPVALERDAIWGRLGEQTRRARFSNALLSRDEFPEARAFVIEHETPEVIWQPHQMIHPNGAVGLVEAWLCAADASECVSRYSRLAGCLACLDGEKEWIVPLDCGQLRISGPKAFAARMGGLQPSAVPGIAGVTIAVLELATTRRLLAFNGIAFQDSQDALFVFDVSTHGTAIRFIYDNKERNQARSSR